MECWGIQIGAFFFSSRRRHTRFKCDWSSDVCSSDLVQNVATAATITLPSGSPPGNLVLEAANPGGWGNNLSALVDYKTKNTKDTNLFNLTITEIDPTTKQTVNSEVFLNVSVSASDPRVLPRLLAQNSNLARVSKDGGCNLLISA